MTDTELSPATRVERLELPTADGSVDLVLDTDTYNEVDDQFAIAHALRSDHTVEALYAAPFHNQRSEGSGDGMAQSYDEIERVLDRMGESRPVFRGAKRYMDHAEDAVESPAVDDLIERAHADRDGPLYVVSIGAATNVASAIAADASIVEEIVVVWLGGTPHEWHSASEFNLSQDVPAARVLFDSGVPLVQVPTVNVTSRNRRSDGLFVCAIDPDADTGDFNNGQSIAEGLSRAFGGRVDLRRDGRDAQVRVEGLDDQPSGWQTIAL
mgnify:CR=1 FL=1